MKHIIIFLIFFVAKAQINICSETGKNFPKAEILLLDENNKIISSYEVNLQEKIKIKEDYTKVAVKLPNHLPLIYKRKVKNEMDLTNPENIEQPYKIIDGKACAIFGDFNNDFVINAMDLHLITKYIQQKHPSADTNNDGKVNEQDMNLIMQNNNKLHNVRIYKN